MSGELHFPEEIVAEILSRVPSNSIVRWRFVSKSWNSILTNPKFLKTHLERSTKQEHIIAISSPCSLNVISSTPQNGFYSRKLNFPAHLDQSWIDIVGSCNGFVLALNGNVYNPKMFLINPTISKYVAVLNSPFNFDLPANVIVWYGLGYDVHNDDFKVVTLSHYRATVREYKPASTLVDVYSLRSKSWRRIGNIDYNNGINNVETPAGVFLHGALHWLASRRRDGSSVIVSFDLSTEKFSEVRFPVDLDLAAHIFYKLVVLKGCLCMVLIDEGRRRVDVWMMKEYPVRGSWVKLAEMNAYTLLAKWMPLHLVGDHELIVSDESDDYCVIMIYDLKFKVHRSFFVDGTSRSLFKRGWIFVESLREPKRLGHSRSSSGDSM